MSHTAYPWPDTPIDVRAVRDPAELQAESYMKAAAVVGAVLVGLYTLLTLGFLLVVFGVFFAVGQIAEWMAYSHLRANGVCVGPAQYPELDAMADNFARRMGIARPEIFVVQQTLWNAFASRMIGKDVVVLYSGAIDALLLGGRPEDLGFLLGHELGHHAAGHLSSAHRLLRLAFFVPFLPAWHRRSMELSCDRLALAACGDAGIALRGLLSMTVGTTMARHTNLDAAIAQWRAVRNTAGVSLHTLYSWYPHHLWRLESVLKAAEAFGLPGADLQPAWALAPAAAGATDRPTRAIPPPPGPAAALPAPSVEGDDAVRALAMSAEAERAAQQG